MMSETLVSAPGLLMPELLRIANANARSNVSSREFYALKDRLLVEHGQKVGEDVQHIALPCYGVYWEDGCQGRQCKKCFGTGVFEHRYVLLERWQLGPYVFHKPAGRTERRDVTIEGYVEHSGVEYADSMRAWVCLALMYDLKLFLRLVKLHRLPPWWPERSAFRNEEATSP